MLVLCAVPVLVDPSIERDTLQGKRILDIVSGIESIAIHDLNVEESHGHRKGMEPWYVLYP
jgi:hypothetical protein